MTDASRPPDGLPPGALSAVIVLAAGASRRFGGTKLLAPHDGRPLVAHAVGTAITAGPSHVMVVVGYDGDRVGAAACAEGDVTIVRNAAYRSGLASSLIAGLRSLHEDVEVAAVLLGDQPGVPARAVVAVLGALIDGVEMARARYVDGLGHPVGFRRPVWPTIERLEGDQGARGLLAQHDVAEVAVSGRLPGDVDEPSDLATLALAGSSLRMPTR